MPVILPNMANEERLNILLVDDRRDKSLALGSVLEQLNQNVVVVHSGREALKELLNREFALVLMDVYMPVMDGFETARLIRERASSEQLPIIFISGASQDDIQLDRGYSLGAVDFILSPIAPEILKAKVSAILELHRKAKNLEKVIQERTAQLRQSEERYRLMLDNARDYAIFLMDTQGRITEWNPGAERILGWEESEVLGQNVAIIFTAEDRARGVPEEELAAAVGGHEAPDERWHLRKDGTRFWASGRIIGLRRDHTLNGFAKILRDFTDRKRNEDSLRFLVDAGAILASSLDYNATLQNVASLAMKTIADFCFFDLVVEGRSKRVAWAHEPAQAGKLEKFREWLSSGEFTFHQVSKTIHSGESELVPYVTEDWLRSAAVSPEHHELMRQLNIRSLVTVPILSKERTIGALTFGLTPGGNRRFTEADLDLGEELGRRVGLAVEKDGLYLQATEAREEAESLNELGKALAAELDVQKLVQQVTDATTRLIKAQFGAFFYNVVNEKGESYSLYTISGVPREKFAQFPMPRKTQVFAPTFDGQGVVRSDDIKQDPRYGKNVPHHGMPQGHLPVTSYLAVPVISRSGEVLGGLFFGHEKPAMFSEREERVVMGLAAQAAIALDNAHLFESAQRERAAARASEARYRTISEVVPQILWTGRPDGWRDFYNQRWFDYTGLTMEQTLGSGWSEAVHPDDWERCMAAWKTALATGEPFEAEYRFRRHDGVYRWHMGRAIPLRDAQGQIAKWFGSSTDIEDHKRAEGALQEAQAKLRVHAAELEDTVTERTAKLRETIGELEAFSYSISHDLRAPLRAMQGYAKVLLEDYGKALPVEGKNYVERISSSSVRMDSLITDVLAYSRILRTDLKLEPIELEPLLREIIEQYPGLQPPRAEIHLAGPLLNITGHAGSLAQCLTNLLGNGVKFVAPGTIPKINVWTEPRGTEVRICIQDNGIGIAPQHQQRIFEIFQRVHPEKIYGGSGIGLAIVRKAVERMGGTFGLESQEGKGSTFWIQLKKG